MTGSLIAPLGDELLDHPDADPGAVARSLAGIARANLWFGGWWAVRRALERVARRLGARRLSLLDVGCGSGDLARRAIEWGRRRGMTIVPVGLERHRTAARLARQAGCASVVGCAGTLPVRAKSVDLVLISQLAHHLSESAIVTLCQAADRAARHAVVIADLRRSRRALLAFQLGARLIALDRVTRLDGLTSIRRGFTREELAGLLRAAGVRGAVDYTPGFRVVATWTPGAG